MNILALEPYYGGSHKAFLKSLSSLSSHRWTILKLPPYKWKWRMRAAAITFAEQVSELVKKGQSWDLIFCSDMLSLAEFCGLCPELAGGIAKVAYFHENQLTYPVRFESERDYQFVMTNMTTALAADEVWFNSVYHRDSFLEELIKFLKRMPDFQPVSQAEVIREKSFVYPQGIWPISSPDSRRPGPMRILWAGRWEHDKNPEDFFGAVKILEERGVDFELSVIGESFRDAPEIFGWAKKHFDAKILDWGFQKSREDYEKVLGDCDVIVSTANHEFFGIGVVEAVSAGCWPILPERLAYPEVFGLNEAEENKEFFYDGSVEGLADKLQWAAGELENDNRCRRQKCRDIVKRFYWPRLAGAIDEGLEKTAKIQKR